jgi:hypothetical protein
MMMQAFDELRATGGLSVGAIARLEFRFVEALRYRPGSRVNLRIAVNGLVAEIDAIGAPRDAARRLIAHIAEHHPDRDALDRVSVLTGERESERLEREMIGWLLADVQRGD